jgi:hypothetical protein
VFSGLDPAKVLNPTEGAHTKSMSTFDADEHLRLRRSLRAAISFVLSLAADKTGPCAQKGSIPQGPGPVSKPEKYWECSAKARPCR